MGDALLMRCASKAWILADCAAATFEDFEGTAEVLLADKCTLAGPNTAEAVGVVMIGVASVFGVAVEVAVVVGFSCC